MKELIIHIGYPRTATTTLQSGLFYELHNDNVIKYFGKSYNEDHDCNYAREIFKNYIARPNFNTINLNFSSEKINLISIDELTFPEYFSRNYLKEKLNKSNPLTYPEKLSRLIFLKDLDEIKILVTLRNQKTAIHSHYVQLHKYFHLNNDKNVDTWEKYLLNGLNKEKSILSTYYYHNILNRYAKTFGKDNLRILLFEDLVNDKKEFTQQLSEIFNTKKEILENNYLEKKKNKTKKTVYGSYGSEVRGKKILSSLYQNKLLKLVYKKAKQNRYAKSILDKILFRNHLMQEPTKNHKNIIFSEFRNSNLKLKENFNVKKSKLKKYGYI